MLQSQVLDKVFIRIRDNLPTDLPSGRIFTATTNPNEQDVDDPKVVLYHEPATSSVDTLGNPDVCRRFTRGGTVRIMVHTGLIPNSDTLGIKIAEQLQELFEGYPGHAPLYYDAAEIREPRRDSAWWTTNLVLTYRLSVVK